MPLTFELGWQRQEAKAQATAEATKAPDSQPAGIEGRSKMSEKELRRAVAGAS